LVLHDVFKISYPGSVGCVVYCRKTDFPFSSLPYHSESVRFIFRSRVCWSFASLSLCLSCVL